MLPEPSEPQETARESQDLFAEPRDHANQWDVSAFVREPESQPKAETQARPVVE